MSYQPYTSDHNREDRPNGDALHGAIHGSFSLPATILTNQDDVIDQLISFAFDVLDLQSLALRVYEPDEEKGDGS